MLWNLKQQYLKSFLNNNSAIQNLSSIIADINIGIKSIFLNVRYNVQNCIANVNKKENFIYQLYHIGIVFIIFILYRLYTFTAMGLLNAEYTHTIHVYIQI